MTTLDSLTSPYHLNTVEEAVQDLRQGKMIILLDREDRENEGDLVVAAEFASPEIVNMMVTHGRGLICTPLTAERLVELELPLMVTANTESHKTAFTVSCDLIPGNTTGISAADRSRTIKALVDPATQPSDLARPGHIFPLMARQGGVLMRTGQTEGSLDLCRIAGLRPGAAICEILNDDGSMARMKDLVPFAERHDLKLITVPQIIDYRKRYERLINRIGSWEVQTECGTFTLVNYGNTIDDRPTLGLIKGNLSDSNRPPLVRVQVENAISDSLGITSGRSLGSAKQAMKMIAQYGNGCVLYIFSPTRLEKVSKELEWISRLAADKPMSGGTDKLQAVRDIGLGAQILRDLGITKMRLISSHQREYAGLEAFGLEIIEQVPFDRDTIY